MTNYKYSSEINENSAKAIGLSLPISTRQSIEICSFIRGKKLQDAKKILESVLKKKTVIPFKRFTNGLGHKPGIASGRYPQNASEQILKMLKSVEANAQFKGLSTADLIIKHIIAQKGPNVWRYGRQKRRHAKKTHIEVIVEEIKTKHKDEKKVKEDKK